MASSLLNQTTPTGIAADLARRAALRPRSRWVTRIAIPFTILFGAAGLLAYSARRAFVTAVDVRVVPVVAKPAGAGGVGRMASRDEPGALLVQSPGWVEADPYAINVPALAAGVIREVLVLEGDRVEKGQIMARMIEDDARLSLRAAEAKHGALQAGVVKSEFDLQAAEARADEINDRLRRDRDLVATGGVSQGELAQLEHRARAAQGDIDAAKAAIEIARADVVREEVAVDAALLELERTEIRAPVSGVVMSRLIEPGARISMASRSSGGGQGASESMSGVIARLYDPEKLQVRAEIPLADSAKIEIGCPAEITTEALPDVTLTGRLTRVVHEANIQRNTVQVKIAIDNPPEKLKPEMLTRVRIFAMSDATADSNTTAPSTNDDNQRQLSTGSAANASSGLRLLIPAHVLIDRQANSARVWTIKILKSGETVAELRAITLGGDAAAGSIEVLQGVRLGDRIIVDPPAELAAGRRVRVVGEASNQAGKE